MSRCKVREAGAPAGPGHHYRHVLNSGFASRKGWFSGMREVAVGMVPVSMPALKPGAVIHGPKAMTDTLLADFAVEIQRRGFKVAGLIQRNGNTGDQCACVMELIDLGSGDAIRISQELGAGPGSC